MMSELGTRLKSRPAAWIVAAILLAVVALALSKHGPAEKAESDTAAPAPVAVETALAEVRPMDTLASAQGTLVPSQGGSAKISVVSAGRLLSVRVREGDRVAAGEVVATVDGNVQQAQARSAAAALRASRIQADQANQSVKTAAEEHANSVKVAKLELATAETELRKLKNGARPQEIAQADQAIAQAKATAERAQMELDRVKFLNEKGVMAKRQLDDAETALSVAKSALETARQQAALVREGARAEDIQSAELRVETARANLDQAKRNAAQITVKKREAQAATESVAEKSADLAAAESTAGYSVLRSPIPGVVTRRALNPGDMADPAAPVLEIANSASLDLSANLPADEGSAIRVGMTARVSAAGNSGASVPGRVLAVGQIDPQTGLLAVRVTIPNPSGALKIGAFATAAITLHTSPSAVAVPKQAVISREGKPVVLVVGKDNVAHQREVETGVEQNGLIEITKGLSPGERVIRLGQYELTDGAKVEPK